MAYCDYCHEGIGPNKELEYLFHKRGMFNVHDTCRDKMMVRLDQIDRKKSLSEKSPRDNNY